MDDYMTLRTFAEFLRYIPGDREAAEVFISLVDDYGFTARAAQQIERNSNEYRLALAAMKYRRTNANH